MVEPTIDEFLASDGYIWKYRTFRPESAICGSIVAVHGIQSHGGWYTESSCYFASVGWQVAFLDRRGSGLNDAARGDAPSFRRLLDDIAEFLPTAPKPCVLMGISWGGKLAVAFQRRHPGLCDGLILVAPGIRPQVRPRLTRRLAIAAIRAMAPTRRFEIPLNDPQLFTKNSERRRFIADDPLALRDATSRFLFESARLDVYLRFCRRHVKVPTLVLLAERDRIIDNWRTRRYVGRFRGATETIEYAHAHHTLEFEPGGPPFTSDMETWLRNRVKAENGTRNQ